MEEWFTSFLGFFFLVNQEILSKVAALSNQGPRTVSVLSAAGAVSRVILHNPGGIHNYKVFNKLCSFTSVM